ncbi:hypothetical protein NIES4101_41000 [Calothrix sp. NIES-4101]|nr:hypothetical protein NIES4101_41000 [Calothrix sp. NIES-4101]
MTDFILDWSIDLPILVAAVIPALLLLGFYYWRLHHNASFLKILSFWVISFFVLGIISGLLALGLQWGFDNFALQIPGWRRLTRNLIAASGRQTFVTIPIEEGCKLIAFFTPIWYFQGRYHFRLRTIFLLGVSVCLGFSTQENVVYVFYDPESLLDRIIGTPFHAFFSAPWIYILSKKILVNLNFTGSIKHFLFAWLNSIICHLVVNILATAGEYDKNLQFFSYGLFPFLLWMFWRFEQFFCLVQNKPITPLISGVTPRHRYWQRGLILFALILGGNAIFGMFVLIKAVSPLISRQIFDLQILWLIFSRTAVNLIFGIIAIAIYIYLRNVAKKYPKKY